tara:strand:- start:150 stop:1058 length:909 start_codon:yes stop_codon:yes gene_type:complete
MNRRKFNTIASLSSFGILKANASQIPLNMPHKYNLNYAPHLGMFKASAGNDPIDQLNFMADQGFRSFEDNDMRTRSVKLQEKMSLTMQQRNLKMGVFVAHDIAWKRPNLASGDIDEQNAFLIQIKKSIEVAKRINAKWMTVVPGLKDFRKNIEYQTVNVINTLKKACDILEPHGLIMVIEPLNFKSHPGLFLTESPQANSICKAVGSSSCKILFDIYHQQIQEGNLIPNIESCWDEIAYFQIGDNPGRNEPYSGEINYKNIFKYIFNKGFKGILGMEHGNSLEGKEGELKVIKAYQMADNFV